MEDLPEQPADSTEEEKEEQKSEEKETNNIERGDDGTENTELQSTEIQENINNADQTNGSEQGNSHDNDTNNAIIGVSDLESEVIQNQQHDIVENEPSEETKEENGEMINQMSQVQE